MTFCPYCHQDDESDTSPGVKLVLHPECAPKWEAELTRGEGYLMSLVDAAKWHSRGSN